MATAAERMRRCRELKRQGKRLLRFPADDVDSTELLIQAGELDPLQADNDDAVNQAAERLWRRLVAVDLFP